jgi:hypothetical protein
MLAALRRSAVNASCLSNTQTQALRMRLLDCIRFAPFIGPHIENSLVDYLDCGGEIREDSSNDNSCGHRTNLM